MKYTLITALVIITMVSCKQKTTPAKTKAVAVAKARVFPAEITKVFDAHGSLQKWNNMKAMSYEIVKDGGNEAQYIDLHNRRERIEASNFTSGYDGKQYWVQADTSYDGNAKFYTNLMFYFYAMPFVLADEGINYDAVDPITFDGVSYPGYRISYNDGVGISSKDEYFLHLDPKTSEMAWLGYTVTYFSGEKSEKKSWIRYNDWKTFNGVKLPNSISWYTTVEGIPAELRNSRSFDKVYVSKDAFADDKFAMTPGAKIVD